VSERFVSMRAYLKALYKYDLTFLFLYFYQNSVKTEFYDKPRKTVQETSSINSAVSIDVTGTEPWHIYRALCICIMRCIFVAR